MPLLERFKTFKNRDKIPPEYLNAVQDDIVALNKGPFYLHSATYDSTNDKIDATLGPGISDFLQTIITKTVDTVYSIPTPAVNTSYYIYIKSDGTFTHNTTGAEVDGAVKLWIVATGSTVDAITTTDQRGRVSGSAQAVKDLLDSHEAAADPHPQYETSAEAQAKANTAETNAKTYSDNTKVPLDGTGTMTGPLEHNWNHSTWTYMGKPVSNEVWYILLAKLSDGGVRIAGEIHGQRSSGSSAYTNDRLHINVASNVSTTPAFTASLVRDGSIGNLSVKLVTLTYNAESYIGIELSTSAHYNYDNVYFKGHHRNHSAWSIVSSLDVSGVADYTNFGLWHFNNKPIWHGENVEYGSNANGKYVRFPNGVQICWAEKAVNYTLTGWQDGPSYPASFATIPVCSWASHGGVPSSSDYSALMNAAADGLSGMWRWLCDGTGVTTSDVIGLIAIGRWK
jgi:hypothetical protein